MVIARVTVCRTDRSNSRRASLISLFIDSCGKCSSLSNSFALLARATYARSSRRSSISQYSVPTSDGQISNSLRWGLMAP